MYFPLELLMIGKNKVNSKHNPFIVLIVFNHQASTELDRQERKI